MKQYQKKICAFYFSNSLGRNSRLLMEAWQAWGSPIRNSLSTGKATPFGFFTKSWFVYQSLRALLIYYMRLKFLVGVSTNMHQSPIWIKTFTNGLKGHWKSLAKLPQKLFSAVLSPSREVQWTDDKSVAYAFAWPTLCGSEHGHISIQQTSVTFPH